MPLMPVKLNAGISYFDGPPIVSCAGFCVQKGKLTEAVDNFAHPFWDTVRDTAARKSIEMRRQGFFGAAMLPMSELEYTGIVEKLTELEPRFKVRAGEPVLQVR
jgi:fructose 1,6-bisphosphate aldolase/phosphatase